ncbi:MAG TPA: acetyl-CoA carboxylase biotin carboxyl carrier protein subunit, partial [Solirubrobacteraceae bacterium]|nr:acetyl-CoA carboxylase biotin carboxyl carrier protein subunit [Solirubrobacteraceae bacterium]
MTATDDPAGPPTGGLTVKAPFAGVVVSVAHAASERVAAGAPLLVLEAMKMEHEVLAEAGGVVRSVEVAVGDAVEEGQVLLRMSAGAGAGASAGATPRNTPAGTSGFRADLEAVRERHAIGL